MSLASQRPLVLSRRVDPSAVVALLWMTVARLVSGRRLIVLGFLFALPAAFAVLGRNYDPGYDAEKAELVLVFGLIPQTLLPLTALVFASGMIRDEVEEQTLTYLLIRPLPRSAIYLVKLAGTFLVTSALTVGFTLLTFAAARGFAAEGIRAVLPERALGAIGAMLLASLAYLSLFGLISLVVRQSLVLGVAYIILMEGLLANIEFVARKLTIMYQSRVLTIRWLDLNPGDWGIALEDAPSQWQALAALAIASAVLAGVGAVVFSRREYRLKTADAS